MMNRRLRLSMVALIAGGTAAAALAVDSPALAAPAVAPAAQQTTQARTGAADTEATTSATHVATHVAARRGRGRGHAHAQRYAWERVAPAKLPDGSSTGYLDSTAVGISDAGAVAGNVENRPFRAGTWLDATIVAGSANPPQARAIAPNGSVAGSGSGPSTGVVSWDNAGPRTVLSTSDGNTHGDALFVSAINSAGAVLAEVPTYRVGHVARWASRSYALLYPPRESHVEISGLSEGGQGVGTLTAPAMRNDGFYPNAVSITSRGIQPLRSSSATTTSAADAVSPDGRSIVGRVGITAPTPDNPSGDAGTVSWLSSSARPATLSGARGFMPRAVNNNRVVAGTWRGHAAVWQNGSLTDLNGQVRGLPSGWVLTDAVAINKSGALAVNAKDGSGNGVALKLTVR